MALTNYGPEGVNLTINGIPIEELGTTDPPITVADVENPTEIKRGLGGSSVRMDRVTRAKRLTVNVMPGSAESRQLIALIKSGADISFALTVNGTNEKEAGFDGVPEQRGDRTRGGGSEPSDDQFVFLCADGDEI